MVSPIPEGMNSVIPYLIVPNSEEALEFYSRALGAETVMRMPGPGGQGTMHAEMRVAGSIVMLTDENPQWDLKSSKTLGGSPVSLMVYVDDVDATVEKAISAGCEPVFPVSNMFWGDRMGKLVDPYGFQWAVATHVEDVPPEEMPARQAAWLAEMAAGSGPE